MEWLQQNTVSFNFGVVSLRRPWNPLDVSVRRIAEEWTSVRRAVFGAGAEPSERQFREVQKCADVLHKWIRHIVVRSVCL